jgi:hypothetical protein
MISIIHVMNNIKIWSYKPHSLISVFNATKWPHAKANTNFQSTCSSFFLFMRKSSTGPQTHFVYRMLTQRPAKQVWDFCNMWVFWEVNVVSTGKSCQAMGLSTSCRALNLNNLAVRTIQPYWHPIFLFCVYRYTCQFWSQPPVFQVLIIFLQTSARFLDKGSALR